MHRSIAVHTPYNLFILTKVKSKTLTTSYLLTIEHMVMFVVKSIHIKINGQVMDLSIVVCLFRKSEGMYQLSDHRKKCLMRALGPLHTQC